MCLITLLDNADTHAVPDHEQRDLRPDESLELSAAADEKKSSWKPTAFATVKLLLYGMKETAFDPLRSVAGSFCYILEDCEVWSFPACAITTLTGAPANERTNERVVGTSGQGTCRTAPSLGEQGKVKGLLNNVEDADKLGGLIFISEKDANNLANSPTMFKVHI